MKGTKQGWLKTLLDFGSHARAHEIRRRVRARFFAGCVAARPTWRRRGRKVEEDRVTKDMMEGRFQLALKGPIDIVIFQIIGYISSLTRYFIVYFVVPRELMNLH